MKPEALMHKIESGAFDTTFHLMYGTAPGIIADQRKRYLDAIRAFSAHYPQRQDVALFSAPGRTEIGGNHTDHQHGCVLAAAVNLDVIAVVAFHQDGIIRLQSKGYPADTVALSDLAPHPEEQGTSAAIIRGMAAHFAALDCTIGGFDAYTTSDVLSGSGLSSSAAFEVLLGTILDQHYNRGKAGAVSIAKAAQRAENVYFGKASGLMDQMVSAVGGFVGIDFADPEQPKIENHIFNFDQAGYTLCITDTKGSHADLTPDYSAVPQEMGQVAQFFGKSVLRDVEEDAFLEALPRLREHCSDRAILRAAHFFAENKRAIAESQALSQGDMPEFLRLVQASGDSSDSLLQNLYSVRKPEQQALGLGIWRSKQLLQGKGAVRVHGGGFAGTIQAFVPLALTERYIQEMNRLFGNGSCQTLRIRPMGGVSVTE
ncbi:galactokinase family protein [uncultured Ruminococcus sp.]|uniref:galactokinase n=1 Tax=uncultured Ruminococcus sp. TaxID=165186 RepID=UPI0025FD867F|nr:galactokinase family protein [uncultured Ruminococcus sp.]